MSGSNSVSHRILSFKLIFVYSYSGDVSLLKRALTFYYCQILCLRSARRGDSSESYQLATEGMHGAGKHKQRRRAPKQGQSIADLQPFTVAQ